jgi:hypothetical protein
MPVALDVVKVPTGRSSKEDLPSTRFMRCLHGANFGNRIAVNL